MKYADLIRAALDGEKLQFRTCIEQPWKALDGPLHIVVSYLVRACDETEPFVSKWEFREAPPPVVKEFYYNIYHGTKAPCFGDAYDSLTLAKSGGGRSRHATVKLTLTDGIATDVQLVKE